MYVLVSVLSVCISECIKCTATNGTGAAGTGTNACYMEKLDKVELWHGTRDVADQVGGRGGGVTHLRGSGLSN